jgi:hypothetical protein
LERLDRSMGEPGTLRLWFGTLGALVAWGIHFATTYPLVPLICATGWVWLLYIIAAVTFVVAVIAAIVSWFTWKGLPEEERGDLLRPGSRRGFMAFLGIIAGVIFIVAIILGTIPIFIIDPCA